jgi:hypothetical protein
MIKRRKKKCFRLFLIKSNCRLEVGIFSNLEKKTEVKDLNEMDAELKKKVDPFMSPTLKTALNKRKLKKG